MNNNKPLSAVFNATSSWRSYATAVGGLVAAGGFADTAHAGILFSGNVDLTMSTVTENNYFDLDQSGSSPYALLNGVPSGADIRLRSTGAADVTTLELFNGAQVVGYYIEKLSAGTTIDSSSSWFASGAYGPIAYFEFFDTGSWQGGGEAYIGLRIPHGPDFNYGWAHLVYDDVNNTMTLKGIAIETTLNQGIQTGDSGLAAVPEPCSALLLAMGIGGLALRRRKAAAV